jgi:hypothetical protein
MVEARRIALEILARAEQERREYAEQEAGRGMEIVNDLDVPTKARESN